MSNNIRMLLMLLLSALVHVVVFNYIADESNGSSKNIGELVTLSVELIPGKVNAVNDNGKIVKPEDKKINKKINKLARVSSSNAETEQSIDTTEIALPSPVNQQESVQQQRSEAKNNTRSKEFLELVYIEINKNKHYPYQARRQRREGQVKVNFKLHPDGHVSEVMVIKSSQFNVLDVAAQQAVKSISPFLIAANYLKSEKEFNVDIDYQMY